MDPSDEHKNVGENPEITDILKAYNESFDLFTQYIQNLKKRKAGGTNLTEQQELMLLKYEVAEVAIVQLAGASYKLSFETSRYVKNVMRPTDQNDPNFGKEITIFEAPPLDGMLRFLESRIDEMQLEVDSFQENLDEHKAAETLLENYKKHYELLKKHSERFVLQTGIEAHPSIKRLRIKQEALGNEDLSRSSAEIPQNVWKAAEREIEEREVLVMPVPQGEEKPTTLIIEDPMLDLELAAEEIKRQAEKAKGINVRKAIAALGTAMAFLLARDSSDDKSKQIKNPDTSSQEEHNEQVPKKVEEEKPNDQLGTVDEKVDINEEKKEQVSEEPQKSEKKETSEKPKESENDKKKEEVIIAEKTVLPLTNDEDILPVTEPGAVIPIKDEEEKPQEEVKVTEEKKLEDEKKQIGEVADSDKNENLEEKPAVLVSAVEPIVPVSAQPPTGSIIFQETLKPMDAPDALSTLNTSAAATNTEKYEALPKIEKKDEEKSTVEPLKPLPSVVETIPPSSEIKSDVAQDLPKVESETSVAEEEKDEATLLAEKKIAESPMPGSAQVAESLPPVNTSSAEPESTTAVEDNTLPTKVAETEEDKTPQTPLPAASVPSASLSPIPTTSYKVEDGQTNRTIAKELLAPLIKSPSDELIDMIAFVNSGLNGRLNPEFLPLGTMNRLSDEMMKKLVDNYTQNPKSEIFMTFSRMKEDDVTGAVQKITSFMHTLR